MKNNGFWNDAARGGLVMAALAIIADVTGFYVQYMSLPFLILSVLVLTYLMRRRVAREGDRGCSYGACLGFMVAVMLCAGFVEGAFMGVAANWLFSEQYTAMMAPSIAMLDNSGLYSGEQLDLMVRMMRSPLVLIFGGMIGSAIKGAFFGLIIAAFTHRNPDVFADESNE